MHHTVFTRGTGQQLNVPAFSHLFSDLEMMDFFGGGSHVEKNACSFLQSKHSGSPNDCSDFFKDLDTTYYCFLDFREHNETEVSVVLLFLFFQT